MQTWNHVDKTEYKMRGPWDDEPDKAHWIDEATGLDCLIHRGPHGALCGYVGVPESSKYFGIDYDDVPADVHGGLTFSNLCRESKDESKGICHPKQGAANEKVWWLGFDCAHAWDLSPRYSQMIYGEEVYRDFEYVKLEVEKLAAQLFVHFP